MTDFSSLNLAAPVAKALADEGYATPTPIQAQAIPPALQGRDILGIAQTGTGKTAAFALPILDRLSRKPGNFKPHAARVLVLAPTRELASQIAESFRNYGRHLKLTIATVFGGIPINRQKRELQQGIDVLVATPGRLIDLIQQNALTLKDVEVLVLDEADQMLDMGFIHSLRKIIPLLPQERQTMFFSATMPKQIADLAAKFITDPVKVSVTPQATTAERVEQSAIHVNKNEKQALLVLKLRELDYDRVLIFTRTKHGADKVVKMLARADITAAAIHGNKSQPQRERTLAAYRDGSLKVLVATDIAARGIDIPGVSHVLNFEVPNVPEQYVHRIGRTARAGREGMALSFVDNEERAFIRQIERITRQKIPTEALPENFLAAAAEIAALPPVAAPERPQNTNAGNGKGRGRGGKGRGKPGQGGRPQGGRPQGDRANQSRGGQQKPRGDWRPDDRPDGEERRARPARKPRPQGDRPAAANGDRPEGGEKRDGERRSKTGRKHNARKGRPNRHSAEGAAGRDGTPSGRKPRPRGADQRRKTPRSGRQDG